MGRDDRYIREAIEAEALAKEYEDEIDEHLLARDAALAEAYTNRWHVTSDWAFEVLEWDSPTYWFDSNPRVTRVRAAIVREADNEEEAYKRAIPVELIDDWLATVKPPGRDAGGHRRVVIRLYTWVIDREHRVAYDGEWLKIADDMSAQAATARALRWAHDYADSLIEETASREIRMTQVEIVWWTATDSESYA
jgi:hypothetical protein